MSKLKKFKSRFKRFVLVLPAIVCIVFSFVPIYSFALDADDFRPYIKNYCLDSTGFNEVYGISPDFYFNYSCFDNDDRYMSFYVYYNYSDFIVSQNEDSDLIIIDFPSTAKLHNFNLVCSAFDSGSTSFCSYSSTFRKCDRIVFNKNTRSAIFYKYLSSGELDYYYSYDIPVSYDTNLFEDPFKLNVDVTFSPALSGEVDRSFENNGKTYYDKSFEMTVTNNSSKAIQYRMFIQEGELRAPSVVQQFKSDLVFYYMSVNWVYSGDVKSGSSVSDYVEKQLKPTNWMYCASGESNSHLVNWNQVNLKQGQKYSVFVQAVLTDETVATEVFTSGARHSVSLSDAEYVFGSEFSVKYLGDVSFDASCSDNGIVPLTSDRDLAEQLYTRYAYFDPTKPALNNTVYDEYHALSDSDSWYYDEDKDTNPWGQPIYVGGDSYSNQSNDINNFMTSSSAYLRFLSSVYGFFPVPVWTAISCGIFLIVIIGIVKRLG